MGSVDAQWILSATNILTAADTAMHVNEIEEQIRLANLVSEGASMPLEVLLTKEAAMGRKFIKPDGYTAGYFSLLPSRQSSSELHGSTSPSPTTSHEPPTSPVDTAMSANSKYQQKYSQLKRTCKQIIYLNAALYDEIARIEKKIEKSCKERRVILQKVMADQNIVNHKNPKPDLPSTPARKASESEANSETSSVKDTTFATPKLKTKPTDKTTKRKDTPSPPAKKLKLEEEDGDEEESSQSTPDKAENPSAGSSDSKLSINAENRRGCIKIPPISLDSSGRPVLPIELPAGLTIYSIGEISEKPGYSTSSSMYPVGYCSTREYACLRKPAKTCLYTCKISEGTFGPEFEISPDTERGTHFIDSTPHGCHSKLMKFITRTTGRPLPVTAKSDFFGLNHPVVKNLLQCSQGASSCLEYEWQKFEVVRSPVELTPTASQLDPATSYAALSRLLNRAVNGPDNSSDIESGAL